MVIRVEEVLKKITKSDERILKSLEKRIDTELKRKFSRQNFDNNGVYVNIGDFGYFGKEVLDKIKRNYRGAGWNVEYKEDDSDSYFLITPRRKK